MQDRWVSYIFRYRAEDGKKCEGAGYIKIVRTSRGSQDEASLRIGLKFYKPYATLCKVYMVCEDNQPVLLDEIRIPSEERDIITLEKRLPWKDFVRSGTTPKDYQGVMLVTKEGELMAASWPGKDIDVNTLNIGFIPEPTEKIVSTEKTKHDKDEIITEVVEHIKPPSDENRSVEQEKSIEGAVNFDIDPLILLLNTHTKLPQLMDSPFTECVKIIPQDIGRLPIGNWKLGQNSFLTHSYYKYKYLMLGMMDVDSQKKYVIGVPGVFSGKERYLANMFGFSQFVPAQRSTTKTGSFGYWVWEVLRQ